MLQCTSPFTESADIDGAIGRLEAKGADSCFTAVRFFRFLWRTDELGCAFPINHAGAKRKRRQDMEPQMIENGAVYVMRRAAFERTKERFCGKVVMHEVSGDRLLEIDELRDYHVARALLEVEERGKRANALPECIRAVIFDFDGVMTDNRVWISETGKEMVVCDRGDGLGVELLREQGMPMLILSREKVGNAKWRAAKLGIECLHAMDEKERELAKWLAARGISASQAVYLGNDINDLGCMQRVGCGACPCDAHPAVRAAASLVLQSLGGRGAVRELADLILAKVGGE